MANPAAALEALGIEPTAATVYLRLLDSPGPTLAELTRLTGFSRRRSVDALATLESKGLASRSAQRPTRYVPAQPDVALEALRIRQRDSVEQSRLILPELLARYRQGAGSASRVDEFVEVIVGREAIAQRFLQLEAMAQEELLVIDKPPYVVDQAANENAAMDVLQRGVALRTIYDTTSLLTDQLPIIQRFRAAGEQSRTMAEVPIKLVIVDRRVGIVPLRQDEPGLEGRLLVHASPLLQALTMLFDLLWSRAMPLASRAADGEAEATGLLDGDRILLGLLASGLTDAAIARQLGVNERTVTRRIRRIFGDTGARTRFQAGLSAARLKWLD